MKQKEMTEKKKRSISAWWKNEMTKLGRNKFLILLMIPGLIYFIIFHYIPIGGLIIAFKNYKPGIGMFASSWASYGGFGHFVRFLSTPDVWKYIWNTIALSLLHIIWLFPLSIILALFINEIRNVHFKKVVQTVSYLPHFVSVAAVAGMLTLFLSSQGTQAGPDANYMNEGILNQILLKMGILKEGISFLDKADAFRTIYIASDVWQSIGWSAIVYIAALSGIDQELYEAATIDGASRWQKMWHISVQLIKPTIVLLLVMQVGKIMSLGSDKALLLQRPVTYTKSQILSTYVYNMGIGKGQFDYAAAVGLFNSIINVFLVIMANVVSKKLTETSLW
ncbi:MAG: sugar ABC transporter permease [Clostridia bacterium]|nr:sugar ABC transporter permease [Clostridia bacterium]